MTDTVRSRGPQSRLARFTADNASTGLRHPLAQLRYTDQLALTMAWWYYRIGTPGGSRNFAVCSGAPGNGWDITLLNTNVLRYAAAFTTTSKRVNSTTTPTLNAWTHCVVRDSDLTNVTAAGTVDFVINGVPEAGTLVSNGSGSHATGTAKNFTLGGPAAAPGGYGLPAIWNRRLGDSEVLDLRAGADPRDFKQNLIGLWLFEGLEGNHFERDLSGLGLSLFSVNTGAAAWMPAPRVLRFRPRSRVALPSGGSIGSGGGRSQSDATATGAGASIAAGAAASLAASVAFAVGVAIFAGAGVASSPSAAAGSGAATAAAAGSSTSASIAIGSNNNVAQAAGTASSSSSAMGVPSAFAAGDGRSVAVAVARATGASIASGVGIAVVPSIARAIIQAIASAIGWSSSASRAIGDVSPPFDASTLARAPHYLIFTALETLLDFDDLATRTDFDELATQLVFLTPQGAEIMGELKLVQGEVRDVEYVVRGAGGVPLDLTNSTTRKLTVRVPGQTPLVDQADVTIVGAGANGRLKYAANAAIAGVAGRYKALTVITYPGGVVVKSPGEVLVESAIA